MARPVIFAIDDDPEVLQAIEHDLRRHYGNHYRVLRAQSSLNILKQSTERIFTLVQAIKSYS